LMPMDQIQLKNVQAMSTLLQGILKKYAGDPATRSNEEMRDILRNASPNAFADCEPFIIRLLENLAVAIEVLIDDLETYKAGSRVLRDIYRFDITKN